MSTTQRLLTDIDAADILQMPVARLARFAKANKVPHVRLPDGEIRFVEADLWLWIEQHKASGQEVSSCK
jgi:predicted DNA-binding transcriptional regulator AlpA